MEENISAEVTPEDVTAEVAEPAKPTSINDIKRKMKLTGTVKRTELYGAFIDLGVGVDAIIHISQLGGGRVNRVADQIKVGDEVTVWVDKVDPSRGQIIVTMVAPLAVEWEDLQDGQVYSGKIVRLENFGAFVDIGAEKEGLVHVSEISYDYIKHPSETLKVGEEYPVKVLGFSKRKRRINLSIKALLERPESELAADISDYEVEEEEVFEEMPSAMEIAMRTAMGEQVSSMKTTRGRGKQSRKRKDKMRNQQEELLNRTLQYSK